MAREILVGLYPWLDKYILISCEKTKGALDNPDELLKGGTYDLSEEAYAHHCTFQGWESVEGQCPFPWARESNRSFRSERFRIEKK